MAVIRDGGDASKGDQRGRRGGPKGGGELVISVHVVWLYRIIVRPKIDNMFLRHFF